MSRKTKKRGVIGRLILDIPSKDKRLFACLILIIAAAKLALAIAPVLSGTITDDLVLFAETGQRGDRSVPVRCMILALLFFIGYGIDGIVNRSMVRISQNLVRKLRNLAQKKLNRLPLKFLDSHPVGDTLSRVTNDINAMSNSLESTVSALIGQFVLLLGLIVMMFVTNARLALIYLCVTPLGLFATVLVMRATNRLFRIQNETTGDLTALVSDTYANHSLVKGYGVEAVKLEEFRRRNQRFYDTYVKSRFLSGFVIPLAAFTNILGFAVLCVVGGIMMVRHELTIGEFQAFIFFGNMVGTPLSSLSSSVNNIQTGITAAERVYELLDEEEEEEDVPEAHLSPENVRGEVVFSHVDFGYTEDRKVLSDVSFAARPGEVTAITGPSGTGKTTLVNLMMRFYEIQGGQILVDGIDTRKLPKAELRRAFGMVLQDTWIFDGTVAENIAYGRPDASREEIVRAAKLTQCDTFIDKLPEGYDTHISEENCSLSAGERQLLSIARVVISAPRILILDEATSQVDTRTEAMITQAMEELMKGRTSFIIAHRQYTLRNASQILRSDAK